MKYRQLIEDSLRNILPEGIFNRLTNVYQTGKKSVKKIGCTFAVKSNDLAIKYRPGKRKIIDLDMYGWTGVDLAGHLESRFGKQSLVIKHAVNWNDYETDRKHYLGVTAENYRDIAHEGLLLWELSKVSIMKYLGKIIVPGKTFLNDEDVECVRKFYDWSINCYQVISRLFDKYAPDTVILTQGGVYDSRVIVELARKRNVSAVALENCFSSDHFYADTLTGQIVNRHSVALTGSFITECDSIALAVAEESVHKFFRHALANKTEQHRTGDDQSTKHIRDLLSIPAGKKVILFLGQVRMDASIVLDSTLYPDPILLVEQLVRMVDENPDYFLIIRLHPKEDMPDRVMQNRDLKELHHHATLNELIRLGLGNSHNIRIISDRSIDTYSLIKLSDVGVTVNSQSGLEMALLGKPVVTAGRCFYGGKGFTWDLTRPELLKVTIDHAINSAITEDEKRHLIRFCYYLFFEYLIPKNLASNPERLYRMFGLSHGALF